ncbi:MAG TPA: helix-turn-helix domain-containing protein [Sphingomonadaceae bacterium]|nr:helix-turn-helix domain-containing protein [Sphingomonadaceae bacterium]
MRFVNFTTKAASRLERSRQWCDLTKADQVEIDDDRESSMRGVDLGEVRLCKVSMGRHRVGQRQSRHAGVAPVLKFIFQEEGTALIRQTRGSTLLNAGQWCALRKDEAFVMEAPGHSRQITLSLPCLQMRDPRRALEPWPGPQSFRRGAGHILYAAASASIVSAGTLGNGDAALLGTNLIGLLEIALRSGDPAALPDIKNKRRQTALDFIERHLGDPELDVAAIAASLRCSNRTVHKLFEGEAMTVARVIWDRRLERCRMELVDPALSSRSITEIAHHWGFSDSQHFSRAFKSRFGSTPRDYRAASLIS